MTIRLHVPIYAASAGAAHTSSELAARLGSAHHGVLRGQLDPSPG
jgi:hypothetical protein